MAKIPDAPDLAPVEGAPPSTAAVTPSSFGLGEVSQALGEAGAANRRAQIAQIRAQAQADRKAVEPQLLKLVNDNADGMVTDAGQWNGTPGFAQDQIAKARSRAQSAIEANPDWTPGQKSEFRYAADQQVQQFGMRAIGHEASTLQQHQVDAQEVTANGALANFQKAYAPQAQSLKDNYDGSQAGLADAALKAFDAAVPDTVQATPVPLQPKMQAQLAAMRVEEAAKFGALEAHGRDAFVYKNGLDQAAGVINTVSSNPSAYESVVDNNLPAIVATMPPGLRKDALHDMTAQAAQARVRGLIQQNLPGQAQSELNDGRYDQFLKPEEKEQLLAASGAALRDKAPKTLDQALAQQDVQRRAQAETYALLSTGRSTGQVSAGDLQKLPLEEQARTIMNWQAAQSTFAQAGAVRDMPSAQVASLAAAAPPDPADPSYATKLSLWEAQRQAAGDELKARQNPGAWAFAASAKNPVKGAGAAGAAIAQDRGAALQSLWQDVQTKAGPDQVHAAAQYAGTMLGAQFGAGVPAAARQILPQAEASRLAASVVNAAPEQRAQAMAGVAQVLNALPATVRLPDGSYASPQAILGKQLMAGHLTPIELSAIADFGGDEARLGRVTAALNDKTLAKAIPAPEEKLVAASVRAALGPYLTSVAPLPGAGDLAEARIDRTILVAKSLVAGQHMSPSAAAQAAAADLTSGYRFADGYRIPGAVAGAASLDFTGLHFGGDLVRAGAGKMLAQLTGDNGSALYAPAGGDPTVQRGVYAAQIQHSARWVTTPDDAGLALMVPHPDGTWDQVADRYGRPVRAAWSDLQAVAQGHAQPSFLQAPANAVKTPDGQPMPAVSKQAAMAAISWAVTRQENGSGVTNAKGARGLMQVTDATVQDYAPRLGLPVDFQRAQNDDAYNQKIGNAALSDHIQHYGATGPGLGLALAAYDAGRGRVEGYTDQAGYHPGWLQLYGDPRQGHISLDQWVAKLPYKETRDYIGAVLPRALGKLQGKG